MLIFEIFISFHDQKLILRKSMQRQIFITILHFPPQLWGENKFLRTKILDILYTKRKYLYFNNNSCFKMPEQWHEDTSDVSLQLRYVGEQKFASTATIGHPFASHCPNYSNHNTEKRATRRARTAQLVIVRHVPIITCSSLRQRRKNTDPFSSAICMPSPVGRRANVSACDVTSLVLEVKWDHVAWDAKGPHLFARPGSNKIDEQGKKWSATW